MAKKIQFDQELVHHIKTIYGDAELSDKTLRQLYQTQKTNPDIIRKTAQQKVQESYFDAQPTAPQTPSLYIPPVDNTLTLERAQDDLSGIADFQKAFGVAHQKGLKQFKWRSTKANPSVLFAVKLKNQNKQEPKQEPKQETSSGETSDRKGPPVATQTNNIKPSIIDIDKDFIHLPGYENTEAQNRLSAYDRMLYLNYRSNIPTKNNNFRGGFNSITLPFYQQGGSMQQDSKQQELQKAFMAYLIQDAQAQGKQIQSEQDLQRYVQELGENGLKAKYQEFMQKMQKGTMARLGAKLEYYKKLKGVCPEGQELVYFKQGGRVCKACQKSQNGTKVTKKANEVDKFKAGRAQKDACGSKMKVNKCGSKMK